MVPSPPTTQEHKSSSPEPVNVTSRDKSSADMRKLKILRCRDFSGLSDRGPTCHHSVLMRDGQREITHTQRRGHVKMEVRMGWGSQKPRKASSHQKLEDAEN